MPAVKPVSHCPAVRSRPPRSCHRHRLPASRQSPPPIFQWEALRKVGTNLPLAIKLEKRRHVGAIEIALLLGEAAKNTPIAEAPFSRSKLVANRLIPAGKPMTSSLPFQAVARNAASVSFPADAMTTSAPAPQAALNALLSALRPSASSGPRGWTTVASAPWLRATASLASLDAAATTRAPSTLATSIAAGPTPPAAPVTNTDSPART